MGVQPVLESRDISSPGVEYLGVMAWAAQFQWIPDKSGPAELVEMRVGTGKCKVNNQLVGCSCFLWKYHIIVFVNF